MRVFITGEKGFIGRNLAQTISFSSGLVRVLYSEDLKNYCNEGQDIPSDIFLDNGELDITANSEKIAHLFDQFEIDLVVHTAAIVGTDVCALYPEKTIKTNSFGTYNIAHACANTKTPIIYIGTTVIYDTAKYQYEHITEKSEINPKTLYGITKYDGEMYVRSICKESGYCIMRPLFCFGGVGDMNSLISKSTYNAINEPKSIKIFLDPVKRKDYMHVDDFVDSIIAAINHKLYFSNEDFNIAKGDSCSMYDVLRYIDRAFKDRSMAIKPSDYILFYPSTDYLGIHLASSRKFHHVTGWVPSLGLKNGINKAVEDIINNRDENYDPLQHLNKIESDNIDIEKVYI